MRCEISHTFECHMRNKFISCSIWSKDMQMHTLTFYPFQQLSNHVWHYRGIDITSLSKWLICLEKQAFSDKKWSSENRKAQFDVEFPPYNPRCQMLGTTGLLLISAFHRCQKDKVYHVSTICCNHECPNTSSQVKNLQSLKLFGLISFLASCQWSHLPESRDQHGFNGTMNKTREPGWCHAWPDGGKDHRDS